MGQGSSRSLKSGLIDVVECSAKTMLKLGPLLETSWGASSSKGHNNPSLALPLALPLATRSFSCFAEAHLSLFYHSHTWCNRTSSCSSIHYSSPVTAPSSSESGTKVPRTRSPSSRIKPVYAHRSVNSASLCKVERSVNGMHFRSDAAHTHLVPHVDAYTESRFLSFSLAIIRLLTDGMEPTSRQEERLSLLDACSERLQGVLEALVWLVPLRRGRLERVDHDPRRRRCILKRLEF